MRCYDLGRERMQIVAAASTTVRQQRNHATMSCVTRRVCRALAAKSRYEAPKVVSFPIKEMKTSYALSAAGNSGPPPKGMLLTTVSFAGSITVTLLLSPLNTKTFLEKGS